MVGVIVGPGDLIFEVGRRFALPGGVYVGGGFSINGGFYVIVIQYLGRLSHGWICRASRLGRVKFLFFHRRAQLPLVPPIFVGIQTAFNI